MEDHAFFEPGSIDLPGLMESVSVDGFILRLGCMGYGDLLCVEGEDNTFHLLNPLTGQTHILPHPFRAYDDYLALNIAFALGFVDHTNQYVLVSIHRVCEDQSRRATKLHFECDIRRRSVGLTAGWGEIEKDCPCEVDHNGILIDNSAFWVATEKDT
ncbi:OLC1v1032859C1 [Oldenlandia corymbosa var. corymbosa]|uniref:OLC1v1032859C1 n=1 Tax=Oldenlandia corymbosa var. corymbosa TaxID=529605 RepID=A0AAV1CMT0_OLDCO|nr:OLC1v1032859C1 [Oldenlandia corymbosa var. corymbosa]